MLGSSQEEYWGSRRTAFARNTGSMNCIPIWMSCASKLKVWKGLTCARAPATTATVPVNPLNASRLARDCSMDGLTGGGARGGPVRRRILGFGWLLPWCSAAAASGCLGILGGSFDPASPLGPFSVAGKAH
jgi:hypothetical protein